MQLRNSMPTTQRKRKDVTMSNKLPNVSRAEIAFLCKTLDEIYDICALKFKEHVIYCRALEDFDNLKKSHKIMNLSNPMLDDQEKEHILEQVKESPYKLNIETFLRFYHKDGLGNVLKNVDFWIRDNWITIDRYNKAKNK